MIIVDLNVHLTLTFFSKRSISSSSFAALLDFPRLALDTLALTRKQFARNHVGALSRLPRRDISARGPCFRDAPISKREESL